ncbi:MAG: DUF4424 domain-containing protein [Proteobacteria bacterium]|nr:DUF4424 domain-containing protein [Pseudomonadota bacterium]
MSIGGLQFSQTDAIAMESEVLKISLDAVDVQYRFKNVSGKPLTVTVAFPLPDIDLSEAESISLPSADPVNFVDFKTSVDGQPAVLTIDQRAMVGTADVTGQLKQLKVPLLPIGSRELRPADLPAATQKELVDASLLMPAGSDERGRTRYAPAWLVKTSAVREQTFPADRPVLVEHHYRPSVGSSPDTILRKGLRQNKALAAEVARYRKDYCITDAFLSELDKRAGAGTANTSGLGERRIGYVLKTGANWAGPIKSFKLIIDKGAPDRLVSFCERPLTASGAGGSDFVATDFKPQADLKILVIGRF